MAVGTSVQFGEDRSGAEGLNLSFHCKHSTVVVFVKLGELGLLSQVINASWDDRRSIKIGECAGYPAFWSCDNFVVTVLVGEDDECWEVAMSLSTEEFSSLIELIPEELSLFERGAEFGAAT